MAKRYTDITGKRFGRLIAQKYLYTEAKHRTAVWLCKCDCGQVKQIRVDILKRQTRSCGCLQQENARRLGYKNKTHGLCKNRLYYIHRGMLERCLNPLSKAYKNYGGRGIKICPEWERSFRSFYNWALKNGYEDNLTIDRINNDGDYCPENCRWADRVTQGRNTRSNHLITHNGETHCVKEWAEIIGIRPYNIWWRLRKGWPIEKVLTPLRHRK